MSPGPFLYLGDGSALPDGGQETSLSLSVKKKLDTPQNKTRERNTDFPIAFCQESRAHRISLSPCPDGLYKNKWSRRPPTGVFSARPSLPPLPITERDSAHERRRP